REIARHDWDMVLASCKACLHLLADHWAPQPAGPACCVASTSPPTTCAAPAWPPSGRPPATSMTVDLPAGDVWDVNYAMARSMRAGVAPSTGAWSLPVLNRGRSVEVGDRSS